MNDKTWVLVFTSRFSFVILTRLFKLFSLYTVQFGFLPPNKYITLLIKKKKRKKNLKG